MRKYYKDKTLLTNFINKLGKEKAIKTITTYLVDMLGDEGVFYCNNETIEQLNKDYKWLISCNNIEFDQSFIKELESYSKFVR